MLRCASTARPTRTSRSRGLLDAALNHEVIHRQVCLQNYAPLLMPRGAMLVGVVSLNLELLQRVSVKLAPNCAVGVSTPLAINSHVVEAARQAPLAVARAHERDARVVLYGDEERGLDLLRTASRTSDAWSARRWVR